jgi:NAD(P)-dependent dehydrogenase (short-subunit alcohol dehydrogenase family)
VAKKVRTLAGTVAVVAGATRGAGRGIARALGEAGATVYCTGRSTTGQPSAYGRPETIDETAAMINDAGGTAVAVRVDHSVESEVESLFARVTRKHRRLDVVVDSVAGEDPMMGQYGWFWDADLTSQGAPPLDISAEPLGWLPVSSAALRAARTAMRADATSTKFASRAA